MDAKEQEFLRRLQATFRMEADEHLRALSAGLFELEKSDDPQSRAQIVEAIFREAHSLKGAARSVNVQDVEGLCQAVENGLSSLKRGTSGLSPALIELLHQAVEALAALVSTLGQPRTGPERARLRALRAQLNESAQPTAEAVSPPLADEPNATPVSAPGRSDPAQTGAATAAGADEGADEGVLSARPIVEPSLTETVRIPLAKLDPLLRQAEEMIQAKLAAGQRAADLRAVQQELAEWRTGWAAGQLRAAGAAPPAEMTEWMAERFDALAERVAVISQNFAQDRRVLGQMVDEHLDDMKQALMLPVATLVESFPRLVRDLARDQAKDVELVIRGAEIEIDKRIGSSGIHVVPLRNDLM